uniref:Uncharacterized protein n=1 Tax=Arundo donax TaxID=35708 RepID=A0A0A8ZS14_ARUDO
MEDWVACKMAYMIIRPQSTWRKQPSLVCDGDCQSSNQHQIFAPFVHGSLPNPNASPVIHGWLLAPKRLSVEHPVHEVIHLVFCKCQNKDLNHDIDKHHSNDKNDVHRCRHFPAASSSKSTHEADQINQNACTQCIALEALVT